MPRDKDAVLRRITVEYGRRYVYIYLTDHTGKIIEEDQFRQPFDLDRGDVAEEAFDTYQNSYQWLLDTCVFSASNPPEKPDSEDTLDKE